MNEDKETLEESLKTLKKEGLIDKIPEEENLIGREVKVKNSGENRQSISKRDWKDFYYDPFQYGYGPFEGFSIEIELINENSRMPIKEDGDVGWDCFTNGFLYVTESKELVEIDIEQFKLLTTYAKPIGFSLLPKSKHYPERLQYCLMPNKSIGCRLGFKTAIPRGFYAQVVPRSGLALKYGLTIQNSPGTIDSDYRGEWVAIIHNNSNKPYYLFDGEKICQFIIRKEIPIKLNRVDSVNETKRGDGGFGSTGKR